MDYPSLILVKDYYMELQAKFCGISWYWLDILLRAFL